MDQRSLERLDTPLATRVEYHESIGSTQDRARELARAGAPHGTLVLSGEQTGGRGRMGRFWGSPPGGLWLSLVLRPERPALITQAAAVGVAGAMWDAGVEARIKWPNDLLAGGRKLCGILAEAGEDCVVLGVGINANTGSSEFHLPDSKATSLRAELGRNVELVELLRSVLGHLERALALPPQEMLDEWRKLNCTLGERVSVERRSGEVRGRAVDISPEGALVVGTDGGERLDLFEGDVEHLRAGHT